MIDNDGSNEVDHMDTHGMYVYVIYIIILNVLIYFKYKQKYKCVLCIVFIRSTVL